MIDDPVSGGSTTTVGNTLEGGNTRLAPMKARNMRADLKMTYLTALPNRPVPQLAQIFAKSTRLEV